LKACTPPSDEGYEGKNLPYFKFGLSSNSKNNNN
jgi:hypothetical protein